MNRPARRPGSRTAAVLLRLGAGLVGAVLLVALSLPLLVRGPVARWVVARATRTMCGTVSLGGAHAGWAAVIDLVLGRPMEIVVEDLRITGPDGQVVLAAARVEAQIAVRRGGAVVAPLLRIVHGRWRLDLDSDGLGTADAFRAVPPAGRQACLDPHAARRAARAGVGAGGSLELQRVELAGVDAELTFDSWGMTLAGAEAVGSLRTGGGGPVLLFEVHDVVARGGSVRIGGPRSPWRTRVPLDSVAIRRVGVFREAPTDLSLAVDSGTTGRALLTGRALFRNIFPAPGGRRPPGPPGLDADVRWTRFGGALARLEAAWRPGGAWLQRIDGDLHALVKGPFNALEGILDITGGGTRVSARLAGGSADLQLALAGLDTTWMLAPALRPLLGGELRGRFHATAQLAPTFAGIRARIPDAELRLDRRRAPRGPRRYELRIGAASRTAPAGDALYASIGAIRLENATLFLDRQRLSWTGLSAALDAEIAFPSAQRSRSHVDVRGNLAVAALEDWIPDGIATGPLRVGAAASGTLERVDVKLAFPPPATVSVLGQRFVLPRRLDALLTPDGGARVAPFQLKRVGGGSLTFGGRVGPGDRLGLSVGARDYPIAALPGLDRAGLPALSGRLGADLSLAGTAGRPSVKGHVTVSGLRIAHRPIGDLAAEVRLTGDAGDVTATVEPGLRLQARVRRRGPLSVDAEIDAQDRPLEPWLPSRLAGAPLRASGRVTVAYRSGAPLKAGAALSVAGPGLTGVRLEARMSGVDASGHLAGALDVARWPQLWPRQVKSARGVLDLDLSLEDLFVRPRGAGSLRVARDLVVRAAAWPAPLTLAAGGRFDLDGRSLTAVGVALSTPGVTARVGGGATLDFDQPDRTALALQLDADVDATTFPLRLPGSVSIAGRLGVAARVSGTLAGTPGPRVDGRLQMNDLTVRLSRATPAAHGQGVVEAHGDLVRTTGLDVRLDGIGLVRIGSPAHPAWARVDSLSPFRVGRVDVPFTGADLTLGSPSSEFYVPDLDADLRLVGDPRGELTLGGAVTVAGGVLDRSKHAPAVLQPKSGKPRAAGPWWRSLPPHLTLDLELRGVDKGIRVEVPVLPDVTVDFRCHLRATNRGAAWSGRLRGDGAWARAAVTVFDWFRPEDLRRCQLTE